MRHLRSTLPQAVPAPEVLRAGRAGPVLRRWNEIVGDVMAAKSWPDRYRSGTVWVAVSGSAWAQELRMMKDLILERMNEMGSEPGLFTDIRFGVRPLPEDLVPDIAMPESAVELKAEQEKRPDQQVAQSKALYKSIREIAEDRLKNWPKGEENG